MAKLFSKTELKTKADIVFARHSDVAKVYATKDGNVFLSENRAKIHAGKGSVVVIEKEDKTQTETTTLNAKDIIAKIVAIEKAEDLEPYAADERKSVIEAYNKRLAELTPKQD